MYCESNQRFDGASAFHSRCPARRSRAPAAAGILQVVHLITNCKLDRLFVVSEEITILLEAVVRQQQNFLPIALKISNVMLGTHALVDDDVWTQERMLFDASTRILLSARSILPLQYSRCSNRVMMSASALNVFPRPIPWPRGPVPLLPVERIPHELDAVSLVVSQTLEDRR